MRTEKCIAFKEMREGSEESFKGKEGRKGEDCVEGVRGGRESWQQYIRRLKEKERQGRSLCFGHSTDPPIRREENPLINSDQPTHTTAAALLASGRWEGV